MMIEHFAVILSLFKLYRKILLYVFMPYFETHEILMKRDLTACQLYMEVVVLGWIILTRYFNSLLCYWGVSFNHVPIPIVDDKIESNRYTSMILCIIVTHL